MLRSRRLAIFLLVGLTVYSWLGTSLILDPGRFTPSGASTPLVAGALRLLGLDHPFSAPLFVLAVVLVTLSTGACAWERTLSALRASIGRGATAGTLEMLAKSPRFVVAVDPAFTSAEATEAATAVLRHFRLRPSQADGVISGTGSPLGPIGSALFHWALVGMFVFAALGQLTRYEGFANVPIGQSIRDTQSAYDAELSKGAFFRGGFTKLELGVAEIDLDHQADGSDRGPAVLVTVSDGDRELKRQWVYPNSPLQFGALLIHRSDISPVFLGSVQDEGSASVRRVKLYYDITSRAPEEFKLEGDSTGRQLSVAIAPLGGQRVAVGVDDGSSTQTQTAGVGESVELSPGRRLTVDALSYAAQLHVVNDWSVPWLYAMFALGTLGVTAALFIPTRSVSLTLLDDTGVTSPAAVASGSLLLHVRCTPRRNDPAFPRLLQEALNSAVGTTHAVHREDRE